MNDDVLDVHPWALYTAVLSVLRTTPFKYSINVDEPSIRVEDIPDSDVRERALNYIIVGRKEHLEHYNATVSDVCDLDLRDQ